jgi:hypothetical protein
MCLEYITSDILSCTWKISSTFSSKTPVWNQSNKSSKRDCLVHSAMEATDIAKQHRFYHEPSLSHKANSMFLILPLSCYPNSWFLSLHTILQLEATELKKQKQHIPPYLCSTYCLNRLVTYLSLCELGVHRNLMPVSWSWLVSENSGISACKLRHKLVAYQSFNRPLKVYLDGF